MLVVVVGLLVVGEVRLNDCVDLKSESSSRWWKLAAFETSCVPTCYLLQDHEGITVG